jgi:hypothetical protein
VALLCSAPQQKTSNTGQSLDAGEDECMLLKKRIKYEELILYMWKIKNLKTKSYKE